MSAVLVDARPSGSWRSRGICGCWPGSLPSLPSAPPCWRAEECDGPNHQRDCGAAYARLGRHSISRDVAADIKEYFAKHMKKWTTDDLFSGIRIPFEVLDARKFETHPVFVSLIANQVAAE